jgi:hypothetical protein
MRADNSIPRPISEAAKQLARKLGMLPPYLFEQVENGLCLALAL